MGKAMPMTMTRRRLFGQDYFPELMERQSFYRPTDRGIEARIKARLEEWATLRREREP